jgi:hypothetical protein
MEFWFPEWHDRFIAYILSKEFDFSDILLNNLFDHL